MEEIIVKVINLAEEEAYNAEGRVARSLEVE